MKRVLLLFCMVMLIFGLLCGCGGAPADPVDPTPTRATRPPEQTIPGPRARCWNECGS